MNDQSIDTTSINDHNDYYYLFPVEESVRYLKVGYEILNVHSVQRFTVTQ